MHLTRALRVDFSVHKEEIYVVTGVCGAGPQVSTRQTAAGEGDHVIFARESE